MEIAVKGNFGTAYIGDCEELLDSLEPGEYEMGCSDPPYNIDAKVVIGAHGARKATDIQRKKQESYDDNMEEEEYYNWCGKWFEKVREKTKYGVFTCGFSNIGYWTWVQKENIVGYATWLHKNSASRCFVGHYNWNEPIIVYGEFPRKYKNDVFDYYVNSGFLLKTDEDKEMLHLHPKPLTLWTDLIRHPKAKSVVDWFLGSGVTIEVCEQFGIKWVGIDKSDKFISTWKQRVINGQRLYKPEMLKQEKRTKIKGLKRYGK